MTNALKSNVPVGSSFLEAWDPYYANAQRLNKVFMDAVGRLWQVRTQAGAEACTECLSHITAFAGSQGAVGALAGWPPLIQSALSREAQVQRHNLDIWNSALQATTDLLNEGVSRAATAEPGSGSPATGRIAERRVLAVVIDFPDRRASSADPGATVARNGARERSGETARRRTS